MANHRSLDGDFWGDPKLADTPLHCRVLLAGIITEIADDEGRFRVQPFGLLDSLFSRIDDVTQEDIEQDLQLLDERGIIRIYGDGAYAVLQAWFRRQVIKPNTRDDSTLPPPPCDDQTPIPSWEFMDHLRDAYLELETENSRVWNTKVAKWYTGLSQKKRIVFLEKTKDDYFCELLRTFDTEGKGREGKGRDVNDNDSLSEDGASDDAKPKKKRKKRTDEEIQEQIDAIRGDLAEMVCAAIDDFLDVCAGNNKTNQITIGRELTETTALAQAFENDGMTVDAFLHGVQAAVRNDADNVNYVRKAAAGYDPEKHNEERPPDLRETGGGVPRNTLYEHELKKKREGRGRYADDGDG